MEPGGTRAFALFGEEEGPGGWQAGLCDHREAVGLVLGTSRYQGKDQTGIGDLSFAKISFLHFFDLF